DVGGRRGDAATDRVQDTAPVRVLDQLDAGEPRRQLADHRHGVVLVEVVDDQHPFGSRHMRINLIECAADLLALVIDGHNEVYLGGQGGAHARESQIAPSSTWVRIHGMISSRTVSSGVSATNPSRRSAFSTDGTRLRTS